MKACGRLYNCVRCHAQSMICRSCDRGHQYCSPRCAAQARQIHTKRAQKKYQTSYKGRLSSADRQRRFRARQRQLVVPSKPSTKASATKKVTHHSSATRHHPDSLLTLSHQRLWQPILRAARRRFAGNTQYRCHRCGRWLDFLRSI